MSVILTGDLFDISQSFLAWPLAERLTLQFLWIRKEKHAPLARISVFEGLFMMFTYTRISLKWPYTNEMKNERIVEIILLVIYGVVFKYNVCLFIEENQWSYSSDMIKNITNAAKG